ncbi:MAG TPA: SDR family NAD(P)-dependent oxidoreductase, partial [Ramlibacter sp.]
APLPWREGGVYLLAGGTGGLGMLLAEDAARQLRDATFVLAGRSALSAAQQTRIDALIARGLRVEAMQVDIADATTVDRMVQAIVERHGRIDGVVHAAGVVRDGFLLHKSADALRAVFAAKVAGTVHLDAATRGLPLDFFVLFSSAAAALGSAGQADYCAANGFLDAFAQHRHALVRAGERRGRTVAIAWPWWRDGGMRPAGDAGAHLPAGLAPLETTQGFRLFAQCLAMDGPRALVLAGETATIERMLRPQVAATQAQVQVAPGRLAIAPGESLEAAVATLIKRDLADVLGQPADRIQASEPLAQYGLDSIAITRLNQRLQAAFGALPKTLFFQFPTLAQLAGHLVSSHGDACAQWVGQDRSAAVPPPAAPVAPTTSPGPERRHVSSAAEPIAIIGISGRYPQAQTVDDFWKLLRSGTDAVGEIPPERWSLDGFFEPDARRAVAEGKSYSKWGGFLEGFAEFDPLFFQMAPREALAVDPQERLFLQCAWEAMEDAGYTRDALREQFRQRVGVFAGVTKNGFGMWAPELRRDGQPLLPHTSFGSVANRVSYCLDLRGPSMPIDTMCSASLSAIHEACEHIRRGECELAFAGGVNLYLHP